MTTSAETGQDNQGKRWQVVGEVAIGEDRFIVLAEETASQDSTWTIKAAQQGEAARFTLSGRICLIVPATQPELPDPVQLLTARELQIAVLVAQGYQTKRIAHKLQISEWTVCTHLRRIFAKLGVDNRAAMVGRCLRLIERSLVESTLDHLSGNLVEVKSEQRGLSSANGRNIRTRVQAARKAVLSVAIAFVSEYFDMLAQLAWL
jgi:DNA-binding CsgD family transcriptional regulator